MRFFLMGALNHLGGWFFPICRGFFFTALAYSLVLTWFRLYPSGLTASASEWNVTQSIAFVGYMFLIRPYIIYNGFFSLSIAYHQYFNLAPFSALELSRFFCIILPISYAFCLLECVLQYASLIKPARFWRRFSRYELTRGQIVMLYVTILAITYGLIFMICAPTRLMHPLVVAISTGIALFFSLWFTAALRPYLSIGLGVVVQAVATYIALYAVYHSFLSSSFVDESLFRLVEPYLPLLVVVALTASLLISTTYAVTHSMWYEDLRLLPVSAKALQKKSNDNPIHPSNESLSSSFNVVLGH